LDSAIDYGEVKHKKDVLDDEEQKLFGDKNFNEMNGIVEFMAKFLVWEYMNQLRSIYGNSLKIANYENNLKDFKIVIEKLLSKQFIPC